jgi:hypothetical protein
MWWRRRDPEELWPDEASASSIGVPSAEPDPAEDDRPCEEPGRSHGTRRVLIVALVGLAGLGAVALAWSTRSGGRPTDLAPGPLLVSPRSDADAGPGPGAAVDASISDPPTSVAPETRDVAEPRRGGAESRAPTRGAAPPLPGRAPTRVAAGYADEAVTMSYAVSLAERQATLAELQARQQKASAEARHAEAQAREAEIWVRAIERNPKLILQGRLAQSAGRLEGLLGEGPPPPPPLREIPGPFATPPAARVGPSAEPAEAKAPGARDPKPGIDTVRVYLVDRSNAASPEAVVGVGRTVVSLRPGDRFGDWTVAGISDRGIELRADTGQAWRLPVTSLGRGPTLGRDGRAEARASNQSDESDTADTHAVPAIRLPIPPAPGQGSGAPAGPVPRYAEPSRSGPTPR